jgi:hypothetical protein
MKNLKLKSVVLTASLLLLAMISLNLPVNAKTTLSPNSLEARQGRERSIIVTPDVDFRIDIWTNQPDYYVGEDIRIYFHSNLDCFVYIFDIDTNGDSRQIFPNYYDRDNYIRGGNTYSVPDYGYRLEVTGPPGREYLRAVAVRDHHTFLQDFERFDRSDPFPRHAGGFEGFKQKLESKAAEKEYYDNSKQERFEEYKSRDSGQMEQKRDFQDSRPGSTKALEIVPRPVRPLPPYRDYTESYTSFYVRTRWYEGDDFSRRPLKQKKVQFSSIPDDAQLYIDGRQIGKTSQKVYLSYGSHLIRMRKQGYSDWVRYLFVNDKTPDRVIGDLRKHTNEQFQPYRPEWDRYYRDERNEGERRGGRESLREDNLNAPGQEKGKRPESPASRESDDEKSREERRLQETETIDPEKDG